MVAGLDLTKNFLRDEGVKILVNALLVETPRPIVYLNLSNNEFTPKAVGYLCEALKHTNGLIHLNLSNVDAMQKNKVGWQGGKMIADYLHRALVMPCLL